MNSKEAPLRAEQLQDATHIVKKDIVNHIYCVGSRIRTNFFNKSLTFAFEHWQSSVEETLANLSLDSKPLTFVQVTNVTKLQLVNGAEEHPQEKQPSSSRITKSQIGGLDRHLQLVEESMEYALGFRKLPAGRSD